MRINPRKMALAVLFVLILLLSAACAETIDLSVDGKHYTVEIPEEYAVYTSELGRDSSYVKFTGYEDTAVLDSYMEALGSCLIGAETTKIHQIWLSVKDRSDGLGINPDKAKIKAFYDGGSLVRGPYTVETFNGKDYYIFADGESIYEGGINYYISTFFGCCETSLRWESGTGERTEEDISLLKGILHSLQPAD